MISRSTQLNAPPIRMASIGLHRGNAALQQTLCQQPLPTLHMLLADLEPSRAECVAQGWRDRGHKATAVASASQALALRPEVLTITTDDARAQLSLLRESAADVIVSGMVIGTRDLGARGGDVIGVGVFLKNGDAQARHDAERLFEAISQFSAPRTSSTTVSAPVLNHAKVGPIRRTLYETLGTRLARHLQGDPVPSLMMMTFIDTITVETAELHVVSAHDVNTNTNTKSARQTAQVVLPAAGEQTLFFHLPNGVEIELPEATGMNAWRQRREQAAAAERRALFITD